MEILKEVPLPRGGFSTFYGAANIRDIIEHENELLDRARQSYREIRKPTGLDAFYGYIWDLYRFIDKEAEPFYYNSDYIFVPRVRHNKEKDLYPQGKSMTLYDTVESDDIAYIETYPPNSLDNQWLKKKGYMLDFNGLRKSTWSSPVVLKAFLTSMRANRYILFRVFNEYAIEKQEAVALSFLGQLGLQQV